MPPKGFNFDNYMLNVIDHYRPGRLSLDGGSYTRLSDLPLAESRAAAPAAARVELPSRKFREED